MCDYAWLCVVICDYALLCVVTWWLCMVILCGYQWLCVVTDGYVLCVGSVWLRLVMMIMCGYMYGYLWLRIRLSMVMYGNVWFNYEEEMY